MSEMRSGTVGKYRLLAELGHGGMADVYLAVGSGIGGFNKLLVVKVMRNLEEGSLLTMFLEEARLAARLSHPNVVQTYEIGQEGDRYFLAMEYLDGPSFHRLRAQAKKVGGVPLPISLYILSTMLQGLEYAHELKDYDGSPFNVVHRDLSPHNVIATYEGEVKIVDFGIAKAADSSIQTQAGVFKGKLTYAPPEQMACEAVDRRADIFAVGVMLWEAAANARMWANVSDTAIARRVVRGDLPNLLDVNPHVPDRLAEIVGYALKADPAERCPTARALRRAIDDFARESGQLIGPRELADFEATLFTEEREKIARIIETQLKAIKRKSTLEFMSEPLPDAALQTGSIKAVVRRSEGATATPYTPKPASTELTSAGPPPVARKLLLPLAGSVALLLAGGLAWAFLRARPEPVLAAPVVVAAPLPPEPETVDLEFRATPAAAQLTLDGINLATNPFRSKFPRNGQAHHFKAAAAGFVTAEKEIAFMTGGSVELALEPVVAPATAVTPPPTNTKKPKPQTTVQKPADDDLGF